MNTVVARPKPAENALPDDKIGRDDRSALICCHERSYQEYLAGQLRAMNCKVHHATTHSQAIQRLATRAYSVTVLLENLEACTLDKHPLFESVKAMPTDDRRQTFVVMLCGSFNTSDAMHAYAQSVDLLINYQDIALFASLVGSAMEEHDEETRFFKVALKK